MHGRWRGAAAAATVLGSALALGGCSVIGVEQQEPLVCEGESPPSTSPGESSPLLTLAEGESPWDLVTVVYADGVVVHADGGSTLAPPRGPGVETPAETDGAQTPWRSGYVLPCVVTELRERAEQALFGNPDFGRISRPDLETTYLRYDDGVSTAAAEAHGHGTGYSDGLTWSQRRARDDLRGLTDLLRVNLVVTGEEVPVEAVQLDGEIPDGATLASTWPGPPAAEVLGEEGCGVLAEEVTDEAVQYGLERGLGSAGEDLRLRALPPAVSGCG
ncbi:hypothetical protein LQF12_01515 [Ruania suaedae]|uniref:hypothetical protein n=1 Tax=Ruania suaedae TaxID=2897774 RepID=UPI001E41CD7E|nr:hypothetical protein [Ruania suaedae]UFU03318.1 hypothetical protein LQF12_01515 [Ruania suaedae]